MAKQEPSRTDPRMRAADTHTRLRRLERRDWWRWTSALVIILLLTMGVLALSLPSLQRNLWQQGELDVKASGLLGVVLLFAIFAVHQQILITRLRRDMTNQVGMMATLDYLKTGGPENLQGRTRQRQHLRFQFDQRIRVVLVRNDKPVVIGGHTCDLGEGGVAAVLPDSVEPGAQVTVAIDLGPGQGNVVIPAAVRHRRGFRHGFEFMHVTLEQAEQIRRACGSLTPLPETEAEGVLYRSNA